MTTSASMQATSPVLQPAHMNPAHSVHSSQPVAAPEHRTYTSPQLGGITGCPVSSPSHSQYQQLIGTHPQQQPITAHSSQAQTYPVFSTNVQYSNQGPIVVHNTVTSIQGTAMPNHPTGISEVLQHQAPPMSVSQNLAHMNRSPSGTTPYQPLGTVATSTQASYQPQDLSTKLTSKEPKVSPELLVNHSVNDEFSRYNRSHQALPGQVHFGQPCSSVTVNSQPFVAHQSQVAGAVIPRNVGPNVNPSISTQRLAGHEGHPMSAATGPARRRYQAILPKNSENSFNPAPEFLQNLSHKGFNNSVIEERAAKDLVLNRNSANNQQDEVNIPTHNSNLSNVPDDTVVMATKASFDDNTAKDNRAIREKGGSTDQEVEVKEDMEMAHLQQIHGRCILCGKYSLYLCSSCKKIWYCSPQCQVQILPLTFQFQYVFKLLQVIFNSSVLSDKAILLFVVQIDFV